jgi:hypothetical protein
MGQEPNFIIYSIEGVKDYILTEKTFGLNSQWKYKRLWFRRFYNEEVDFSLVVEQSDIGYGCIFGSSDELTQLLNERGVQERKEYRIKSIEGDPSDVHGRLLHLEKDFTLEIKKDNNGSYRIKMYPSDYNGMNQKRCLIRISFDQDPFDVMKLPIRKVYEGPKKSIPQAYRYLFEKSKKGGCLGVLALGFTLVLSALILFLA